MAITMHDMQKKYIRNETKGLKEKLSEYLHWLPSSLHLWSAFGNEFPSFVVLSSLASMELIEKQKQTSKQTENIEVIVKIKVKSKCKNQIKVGFSPNKG